MCGNFQTLAARKSLVSVWQGLPGALEDSCWLCGGTTEPTIMPHKEVGGTSSVRGGGQVQCGPLPGPPSEADAGGRVPRLHSSARPPQ